MSHYVGQLVHLQKPKWFAHWLKYQLIRRLKINVEEAEFEVDAYPSFGAFFSRRLKTGARPIAEQGFLSPCDGRLQTCETIASDSLIQSKGISYSLRDLLGDSQATERYQGGLALTIYLAPHNYHRVHSPDDLSVERSRKISGDLWPVNRSSVEKIHPLFCLNERWVLEAEVKGLGRLCFVMVGATNVGKMELFYLDQKQNEAPHCEIQHESAVQLKRGQELGVFHMGSTVILILDRNLSAHYKMDPSCRNLLCGEKLS